MSDNSVRHKSEKLGIAFGTASARLRKSIMFWLVQRIELDICYRCGKRIETVRELSIEHIVPWERAKDPAMMFFDLDNIAFSHLSCNVGAGGSAQRKRMTNEERKMATAKSRQKWIKKKGSIELKRIRRERYLKTGK